MLLDVDIDIGRTTMVATHLDFDLPIWKMLFSTVEPELISNFNITKRFTRLTSIVGALPDRGHQQNEL